MVGGMEVCMDAYYGADGIRYDIEDLVHKYGNEVLRTAYLYVNDMSIAEDVFQEVFIRVSQKLDTFQGGSSIRTWIIRITINLCKDYLKSAYKRKVVPMPEWAEDAMIAEDATEGVLRKEAANTVRAAINKLPGQYRDVVVCVYYQEMSMKEAAKTLKIPEGTVKTRLFRAKERLKDLLEGVI